MKKNLKKVISAVIALALSASTFATVSFAKSFTDVASTASYAEAVDVLSALGIINGYEDGTFGPDKTIKRSEAAKIIVAMVNKIATAEGRMGATQFDDVAADHWASGFINVGVTDKFINGKSATRFDPDGEVKYNEIVKMIVSCLGYEEYASFYGGYPTGYVSIADSEGITKGCSMDGEAAATRGVVAQLVYNALKTPVIQSKGMQYSAAQGGFVPNIEKQDAEESTYYKTLLTEKFDAYLVEGKVTGTKQNGAAVDADEVIFDVQKTETYYNDDIVDKDGNINGTNMTIKVGETAAADYINTYAVAIMQLDDNDEYTFISFIPSGKNKTVTLDSGLFDEENYAAKDLFGEDTLTDASTVIDGAFVKYFASEDASKSTKYKLDKKVKLYVNGKELTANKGNIDKYVVYNPVGKVELVDSYSVGASADGLYDYIYAEYYGTAKVDSVSSKKIIFADQYGFTGASITLDKENDEDLVYHIYYNDEEVAITDIKKDDILSIKYDVTAASIAKSETFEIYVSRDVQEGKYTGNNNDDEEVTVAGEKYVFVKAYDDMTANLVMGNEYSFLLDKFGRIFSYDTVASSAKYAIFDRVTTNSSWDNIGAQLYLADGTTKSYEIDLTRVGMSSAEIYGKIYKTSTYTQDNKKPIEGRVVEYKLSTTTGKITTLTFIDGVKGDAEYKSSTEAIGAVRMNDTTKIIDAKKYVKEYKKTPAVSVSTSDLSVSSIASLSSGVEYVAYGYGTRNSDNTFPFVVLTEGAGNYTENTVLAVVTKSLGTDSKDDGTEGYSLTALYGDDTKTMFVTDDAVVNKNNTPTAINDSNYSDILKKGDVVVFQLDGKGDIEEIDLVFRSANVEAADYGDIVVEALNPNFAQLITVPTEANKVWTKAWAPADSDLSTSIVYGVVTDKKEKSFQLAQVATGTLTCEDGSYTGKYTTLDATVVKGDDVVTSTNGATMEITTNDSTKVYVFDPAASKSEQFRVSNAAEIVKTSVPKSYQKVIDDVANANNGSYIIPWDAVVDGSAVYKQVTVNVALAKVVDGVATEVFYIAGDVDYEW